METSRSTLELMRRAYELAKRVWPDYAGPFSRHDFTRPQLFACLVVRESLRLSYRRAEAFLADVPDWLAAVGMARAPDHDTPWRAFGSLLKGRRVGKALDVMAADAAGELRAGLSAKPLTIDSTCYEPRHRSRHYDRVCRKVGLRPGRKYARSPGTHGPAAIPAGVGRPSAKAPAGRFRRLMKQRFARDADKRLYGQRAQSETVNSMMKRNLGECLRSTRADRRTQEMLLRSLTHNLMLGP